MKFDKDKVAKFFTIGGPSETDTDEYYDYEDDSEYQDDEEAVSNEEIEDEDDEPRSNSGRSRGWGGFKGRRVRDYEDDDEDEGKGRKTMESNKVCAFKPKCYEDAHEIIETLLQNQTIVLNFEGTDVTVSRRILDTTVGACIAIKGNLQKISNTVFIATPPTVAVSGDLQENITGVFNE